MIKRVLITGGAGFIGSHLADELLDRGYGVRVLDNLDPQTHGEDAERPPYLDPRVELHRGDVRDRAVVREALRGVQAVYHFAAAVGVGQSMYEVERYVDVNARATGVLLEALADRPVERLVVASSMSIYGEGAYRNARGDLVTDVRRHAEDLRRGEWEPKDAKGAALTPMATPEEKPADLSSVYALTKYDQERLCLVLGEAYGIPTVALRFFNVYGPRQALGNPYTGVLAIFASRILNDRPPLVFEDGEQRRDFVSVHDVARASALALERDEAVGHAINVGSGEDRSIRDVAERMLKVMDATHLKPEITGRYRAGDIRHCFADVSRAEKLLGFRPQVGFDEGVGELVAWLREAEPGADDRTESATKELEARGLLT